MSSDLPVPPPVITTTIPFTPNNVDTSSEDMLTAYSREDEICRGKLVAKTDVYTLDRPWLADCSETFELYLEY